MGTYNKVVNYLFDNLDNYSVLFRCVSLSDIKILKQAEAIPGVGGVGQLLQGLGLTPPAATVPQLPVTNAANGKPTVTFPSPLEFVRNAYSEDQPPASQQK